MNYFKIEGVTKTGNKFEINYHTNIYHDKQDLVDVLIDAMRKKDVLQFNEIVIHANNVDLWEITEWEIKNELF